MVGRLGPEALAATGMGGMLVWGALSLVLGIRTSVQTIASRRLGQNKTRECINALNNGFLLAIIYSVPVSLIGFFFGLYVPSKIFHTFIFLLFSFLPCPIVIY